MSPLTSSNNSVRNSNWFSLLLWVLFALFLRWQVIEPRWIPSGSMLPTLQLQDRILVEKVRPRLSRFQKKHLKHEDMVVFYPPQNLVKAGYDGKAALIKRIIGLPGDKIEIHKGQVFRNGKLVEESWRKKLMEYEIESFTVPKNEIWVLGDNRNNSLDSHIWGPLPEANIIGTAIWRYWPIERFGPIRFPTLKKIGNEPPLE